MSRPSNSYPRLFGPVTVFLLTGLLGCTSTESITQTEPNPDAVRALESESRDQSATIELIGGRTTSATRVTVGKDSIRWVYPPTETLRSVPRMCVRTLRFTRHGRGFLDGFGLGLGSSLGAGALAMLAMDCNGPSALLCGLVGGAITVGGTLVGTAIGGIRGHRDVYQFSDAPTDNASKEEEGACRLPAQEASP